MSRHSCRIVPHRPVVLNLLNKIDQICTRSWIVISWKWIIFLLVRRKVLHFYIHLPFYLFDWLMLHISSLLLYAALFGVRSIFVSNLLSAPSIGPYIIGSSTLIALSSSILNFWTFWSGHWKSRLGGSKAVPRRRKDFLLHQHVVILPTNYKVQ